MSSALGKAIRSFGHFWWDFLVGDTPELFVAMLVIVAVAFALRSSRTVAIVCLPALVIVFVLASAWRGRQRAVPPAGGDPGEPARSRAGPQG